MEIKGKNITILGAERSGIAAAKLAVQNEANVFVSDLANNESVKKNCEELKKLNIDFELGGHSNKVYNCDLLITSPGIPSNAGVLKTAAEKGIKIISEIEFASWFCKGEIIAITGTNGKTTTTTLIAYIVNNGGKKCYTAGNIGLPFSEVVMNVKPDEYVALEVSSFQLDFIDEFKPKYSIVLNITPDHLDRYEERFDLYIKSKMRITENQNGEDVFIYNGDDPNLPVGLVPDGVRLYPFSIDKGLRYGSFVDEDWIVFNENYETTEICNVKDLALKGEHNLQNSLAAINVAMNIGIDVDSIKKGLSNFRGVEHRLEFVREINGVKFINDSKATNVDAVWYALRSFDKPIFLILGGKDKGNDYSKIKDEVKNRVKKIYAIGSSAEKVFNYFKTVTDTEIIENFEDAITKGLAEASNGEYVLLSPACASFDMFKNYEDRGQQFKNIVNQL